ncbi:UNVERIFIED_CONTAM: hypothetical protein FKN15_035977 [Acipenser sinensis]
MLYIHIHLASNLTWFEGSLPGLLDEAETPKKNKPVSMPQLELNIAHLTARRRGKQNPFWEINLLESMADSIALPPGRLLTLKSTFV